MTASVDPVGSLARVVLDNLENQQDWTQLQLHAEPGWPRAVLSGLPPRRLYVHPDEQIEIIKAERERGDGLRIPQPAEFEWVLPMHLAEKPSVGFFAAVFDSVDRLPPGARAEAAGQAEADGAGWKQWRSSKRGKRVVLAIVQDDSTVVYYFMHDGIVKPRQN